MNRNNNNSVAAFFLLLALLLLTLWGTENQDTALILYQNPKLILPYLLQKIGFLKLFLGFLGTVLLIWILTVKSNSDNNVLRGPKLVPERKLRAILRKGSKPQYQPQMQLGGMPIPKEYENRGFFLIGSPGSGKSQSIKQMIDALKQRQDFRGIIFDRGGEMLENFYNQKLDVIFNPFDARSCHWCHVHEPVLPETIAGSLIPSESTKDFFSNGARVVMSELFRLTKNNAEISELLRSDIKTLGAFVSGSQAANYFQEERVASSITSTIANFTGFYDSIVQPRNKALSFYSWAASNSPRWIFITLNESDSELLKPLFTLIFELVLKGLISNENKHRKTAVVIDELGALNQLPSLSRLLSESRKFLGCPIIGTQTEAQVTKVYGEQVTRILLQGTKAKLILNCADPATARQMSDIIGKQEIISTSTNRSQSFNAKSGNGRNTTQSETIRESHCVLPSQLQKLKDLRGYINFSDMNEISKVKVKYKKFKAKNQRFVTLELQSEKSELQENSVSLTWSKMLKKLNEYL